MYVLLPLLALLAVRRVDGTPLPYSIYVWGQVFQPQTCGTSPNGAYVTWDSRANWEQGCFERPYNTPSQRSVLFDALGPGLDEDRTINKIFLDVGGMRHIDEEGKIRHIRERAMREGPRAACPEELMTTIAEAHLRGIKVYALFGIGCYDLCEKDRVPDVVDYNEICAEVAQDDIVQFDGVAINNEFMGNARRCGGQADIDPREDVVEMRDNDLIWLDQLNGLRTAKNRMGGLPLHFSIGYNWDDCEIEWEGSVKKVVEHMMDISDSIDVQVAWAKVSDDRAPQEQTLVTRAQFYHDYWFGIDTLDHQFDANDPNFYVLLYANPVEVCQTSFAPHASGDDMPETECIGDWGGPWDLDRTQNGMFAAFDVIEQGLDSAAGSINYYGGVFNTGITEGWPVNSKWQVPGDLCSQDSDCAFTASCVDVDGGRYAEKKCAKIQLPEYEFPKPTVCLPKGFECKYDYDCCKGLVCPRRTCDSLFCKYKYILPSRCEPE